MSTWREISYMKGRNELPWALDEAYCNRVLTDLDEIAIAVEDAWTGAEYPLNHLRQVDWLNYFELVGFLEDAKRSAPRMDPITVYRGSTSQRRLRWSWTDDRDQAIWFRDRQRKAGLDASLWEMTIPPGRALAHFHASRSENEWVVVPKGLRITRLESKTSP